MIDASFALAAVLPVPASGSARQRLADWHRSDRSILAPSHWIAEAVSALRKLCFLGELNGDEANRALDDLFALSVGSVPATAELCRASLRWAERLTHSKAYDAFYLALADSEDAELWTADGRLARRAHQLGADHVHFLEP